MILNNEQYNELAEKLGEELVYAVLEKEASGVGEFGKATKGLIGAGKERFSTGAALRKAERGAVKAERKINKDVAEIGATPGSRLDGAIRADAKKKREDASRTVGMATLPHLEAGNKVRGAKADVKAAVPKAGKEIGLAAAGIGAVGGGGYAVGHRKTAEVLADELLKEAGLPSAGAKRIGTGIGVVKAERAAAKGEKQINKMTNKMKSGPMNDELEAATNRKAYFDRIENSKQVGHAGAANFEAKQNLRTEAGKAKGTAKKVGAGFLGGAAVAGGGYAVGQHAKAAAELLIEGLLYKEAAEDEMFNADILAEASEMALNAYGFSKVAEEE